jgi:hypothetical protein
MDCRHDKIDLSKKGKIGLFKNMDYSAVCHLWQEIKGTLFFDLAGFIAV